MAQIAGTPGSGRTDGNSDAFIEAQQYDSHILTNLHDGLLPTNFYRNVASFGSGTTLNIKTIGTVTLQDITENEDLTYNPIDSGVVQLKISDYVGGAWYITDVIRQDGSQVEALHAAQATENSRALQEVFETRYLKTLNDAQTQGATNDINGFAHRLVASGTNMTLSEADLIDMSLAFDKANVPMGGRIAIVDPVSAAAFSKRAQLTTGAGNMDAASTLTQTLVKDGFAKEHKFITSLYGWDIWTSNRLPTLAAGVSIDGSTNAPTEGGSVNIFMCILDDNTTPGMVAWRQPPKTETGRDRSKKRDEFDQTARWGQGVQRLDTLGTIITSATATA